MVQTATIIPIHAPVKQMLTEDEEKLVEVVAEVIVQMVINKKT